MKEFESPSHELKKNGILLIRGRAKFLIRRIQVLLFSLNCSSDNGGLSGLQYNIPSDEGDGKSLSSNSGGKRSKTPKRQASSSAVAPPAIQPEDLEKGNKGTNSSQESGRPLTGGRPLSKSVICSGGREQERECHWFALKEAWGPGSTLHKKLEECRRP